MSSPRSSVAGVRPAATSSSSPSTAAPPSSTTRTGPPGSGRSTATAAVPVSTSMPWSSSPARTASAANGSTRPSRRSPRSTTVTSWLPRDRNAVASSQATGPPPSTTRRRGAASARVASRLVHGRASARPDTGGSSGAEPVATTTAWAAPIVTVRPSPRSTATRRSPARRPWPRARSMFAPETHSAWPSSFQSPVCAVRRANAASASRGPVIACRAPSTERASASTPPGRSSALLGTQA